jgi:hypothetical protein
MTTSTAPRRREPRELDETLYNLDADETVFFKQQTKIDSDAELKQHIVAVQREAYSVLSSSPRTPCPVLIPTTGPPVPVHLPFRIHKVGLVRDIAICTAHARRLKLARLPFYDRVLALGRERAHPILLDIGCCCEPASSCVQRPSEPDSTRT